MKTIDLMLHTHPRMSAQQINFYSDAINALVACAATCTSCADACLGEPEHLEHLRRCIRLDLDCADICAVTARLVIRQTETPHEVVHAQLHACILACQACSEECETHAGMHEHCRICAETCRHCQERCNLLLGEIGSTGTAEDVNPEESPSLSR
jgi:hypothetical protein